MNKANTILFIAFFLTFQVVVIAGSKWSGQETNVSQQGWLL